MILVEKGPAPPELEEANATLTAASLKIHGKYGAATRIKSSTKDAKKSRHAADTVYITAAYRSGGVKAGLVTSHHAKCAYCETRILAISHGDVEHFRPKSEYTDGADKGMGYFWLAYDWVNLYLGCQVCNETYKGTYFPVMPAVEGLIEPSVRLEPGEEVDASKEVIVLIDPGRENPRSLVRFDPTTGVIEARASTSFVVDASRVGKNVLLLGLNRPDLVASRHRHVCFLRGMFVLAAQGVPVDTGIQDVLTWVCGRIAALTGTADFDAALAIQKELAEACAKVYTARATGPGGDNAWAALRWLCFSVAPLAEYSALAQDCLVAWVEELKRALAPVQSHGITTSPSTPTAQSYTATSNVLGWPPLRLAEVSTHAAALDRAVKSYVEQKAGELASLREAVREELYDELNDLVAEVNRFHGAFKQAKAEDRYMTWRVELQVIVDGLDQVGAEACARQRRELAAFMDQEATRAESARCSALDPRLKQAWSEFLTLHSAAAGDDAVWKRAVETARIAIDLTQLLGAVLARAPEQTDPDPKPPGKFEVEALAEFSGGRGRLLAGLSPELGNGVAFVQEGYRRWATAALTPYQRRWAIYTAGQQGSKAKREALAVAWPPGDELAKLQGFLDAAGALKERVDQLIVDYRDAGMTAGSWRWNTCYSMNNLLATLETAREQRLPSLLDPADGIQPPAPTMDDPWHDRPITYTVARPPQLTWAASTARKRLADFHAARAKLKTRRKLTPKQQENLDELVAEDARVQTLIAKLRVLRKAQQWGTDDDP